MDQPKEIDLLSVKENKIIYYHFDNKLKKTLVKTCQNIFSEEDIKLLLLISSLKNYHSFVKIYKVEVLSIKNKSWNLFNGYKNLIKCEDDYKDLYMLRKYKKIKINDSKIEDFLTFSTEILEERISVMKLNDYNENDLIKSFCELFICYYYAWSNFGFIHGNINEDNIMVNFTKEKRDYEINNIIITIDSPLLFKMIDFDYSIIDEKKFSIMKMDFDSFLGMIDRNVNYIKFPKILEMVVDLSNFKNDFYFKIALLLEKCV